MEGGNKMEHITKITSLLSEIIKRNKKSIANITTKDDEIIINIRSGWRWKQFKNCDTNSLISEIKLHFQVS